jgi:predicted nucleotidyltransferase component of viral defense system
LQQFIDLDVIAKNELLLRASSRRSISPLLLEKDFWVSWILNIIFQMPNSNNFIFKGGTSLSKCFNIINRFSEDIDITIDKNLFSNNYSIEGLSNNKLQKLIEDVDKKAILYVHEEFSTQLIKKIHEQLKNEKEWDLLIDHKDPKSLRFYYPNPIELMESSYVHQSVLIEIGVKGDVFPSEEKIVTSYVEEEFRELLKISTTPIHTLSPLRTFWEKITLLHAENNRPRVKTGDRLSRHYYDVYQLIKAGVFDEAKNNMELLKDVIKNKTLYYRSAWARYEEAYPGSLNITPNIELRKLLEKDYEKMKSMIFGEAPSFTDIMYSIAFCESTLNDPKFCG